MFCQFNSASKIWLNLEPKTNWKSLLKEAKPLQIVSDLCWKLNYIDLCVWGMLLFCKAPNASLNWEDFHLELFLFSRKLRFSPVLSFPNSEDSSWVKLHQNRSNLFIFFFPKRHWLWHLMASKEFFFLLLFLKRPFCRARAQSCFPNSTLGYEWDGQWVGS